MSQETPKIQGEHFDIAIVGGGVSGVYSAYRLKQRYPDKRIAVFEGSDHIGGRLLSVKPPQASGIDDMVAELGGMRILENAQPLIVELLKELNGKLPGDEQIETYAFPVDEPQNIAFLRGVYLRLSDFTLHPDKVPYQLNFLEKGNSAGTLIVNAIEQIVPGITNSDLTEEQRREMARNGTFDGKPLWKQGFWNVLLRVITGEAYQLGVDAGGYNSTLFNWNAADAIPWYLSDFGITPEYKGFKSGFQTVPLTLAQFFLELKGEIYLKHKLEGFVHEGDAFALRINGQDCHADSLILAMPRRSLDLLAPACPLLRSAEVAPLVAAVTPRPLFKLFTTYHYPWWRNAGYTDATGKFIPVQSGRTVTDLPVRQTYYWPTDEGQPAVSGPAMLLASYDDGVNIGFWDGFRPRRRQAWQQGREVAQPDVPFVGEGTPDPNELWYRYQAPLSMVEELSRQLAQIHDLKYSPKVTQAAFRDWGDDPFGGGWNSWNIGVESWKVRDKITHPIADLRLYICGEAYSDAQGWVEGALQTADIMLGQFME